MKVLIGHTEKIRPCIACNQGCITRLQQGKQPTCAVNPAAMREVRYALRPCIYPKKVVVVGGGVAGIEAARTAAMRGHKVSLYEKNGSLGGNLIPGGSHNFKKEVRELNVWYQNELKALPVEIHTGETVTSEQLRNMYADVIILATSSVPVIPNGQMIPDLFEHHHVTVLEKHRLSAVENGKVILECDGQKVSTILHAVWDGYEVGNNI